MKNVTGRETPPSTARRRNDSGSWWQGADLNRRPKAYESLPGPVNLKITGEISVA